MLISHMTHMIYAVASLCYKKHSGEIYSLKKKINKKTTFTRI